MEAELITDWKTKMENYYRTILNGDASNSYIIHTHIYICIYNDVKNK